MAENLLELTNENFEKECLKSHLPVLVDFWAEWCGPCREIASTVGELAEEYADRLKVGKLNVDNARTVAAQYGIRSIPTLLLFKGGQVKDSIVGRKDKAKLKAFLDKNI
jgi:thioredoxin 1